MAMVKNQKDGSLFVFENTLDKGKPQDIRVTGDPESATVIVGLDEGLMSMRVGATRGAKEQGSGFQGLGCGPDHPSSASMLSKALRSLTLDKARQAHREGNQAPTGFIFLCGAALCDCARVSCSSN